MAFNNWVLREQRKYLLDAITADDDEKKERGQKILMAIKQMEDSDNDWVLQVFPVINICSYTVSISLVKVLSNAYTDSDYFKDNQIIR